MPAVDVSLSAARTPPSVPCSRWADLSPLFSPYGLTPATPDLAGRHTLPRYLPILLSARRLLLLMGRRCQSSIAMAMIVAPRTRASSPSVGARASHHRRAPSHRNRPASHLCSEPVRSRCCALHRRWPSPTPHPGQ
jgi:hypothetical protein